MVIGERCAMVMHYGCSVCGEWCVVIGGGGVCGVMWGNMLLRCGDAEWMASGN